MGTTSFAGATFAEKFEEALDELREREPGSGLRTIARRLEPTDPKRAELVRRRLNKYRPKPGGGAAETAPTEPTRREIEAALGLPADSLKPEPLKPAEQMVQVLMPQSIFRVMIREELARA